MGLIDDVMTAPAWEAEIGKSTMHKKIYDAAKSAGINPKEFLQLAQIESGFDTHAESPAGYRGLFQINPEDRDVKAHASSNLPFITPGLYDPDVNIKFATERYKEYKHEPKNWEFNKFFEKVIRHNQGKKGSRQILNAYNSKKSIQETADAPWNRTKKMLNNMSTDDLKELTLIHSKNKDLNRSRQSMIESMIGTGTHPSNLAIRSDPKLVEMYVKRQQYKVDMSSKEVDRILKEI